MSRHRSASPGLRRGLPDSRPDGVAWRMAALARSRRVALAVGYALAALCAGYFAVLLFENASGVPRIRWRSGEALPALATILLVYLSVMVLNGYAWHLLLRALGEPSRIPAAVTVTLLAQFAKYLPGNVGQVIGRVALARRYGIRPVRAGVAIAAETAGFLLAALTVAALAVWTNRELLAASAPVLSAAWSWRVAGAGVAALSVVLIVATVLRRPPRTPEGPGRGGLPLRVSALLQCLAAYVAGCYLIGVVVYLTAHVLLGIGGGDFWLLSGVFAVAWVAGFVTPGAPGGLGVRETVIVVLLSPLYGSGAALGLSVLLRLLSTCGDALGFVVGLGGQWHLRRAAGRAAEAPRGGRPGGEPQARTLRVRGTLHPTPAAARDSR